MDEFVQVAHRQLGSTAREALCRRGVSDSQIDAFSMGVLPAGRLPAKVECTPRFIAWWGACRYRFKNPLVFPLTTALGVVQGLQFRDLDQRIRGYLDYFETKEEPALFGLRQAMPSVWETESVWVVEGVFDLCPIQRHVPNVIATLHAGIPSALRRLLRRVARTLFVAYDMDPVGRKVSYELARELKDEFKVKIVGFPRPHLSTGRAAKDPNELWSAWGDESLASYINRWCA